MRKILARLLRLGLAAGMLAGCSSGVRWERPVPRDLRPLAEAFRLEYTEILAPEDRAVRTEEEVRALERRAAHAPSPLPLPPAGFVLVASAAGQGSSGEPSISYAGYHADADTVTVYVTVVRSVPGRRECHFTDDVAAVVIGAFVPAAPHVRFERIHGRRPC